jgi:hypothetical protein
MNVERVGGGVPFSYCFSFLGGGFLLDVVILIAL